MTEGQRQEILKPFRELAAELRAEYASGRWPASADVRLLQVIEKAERS